MRQQASAHWLEVSSKNPHLWDGRVLGTTAPGYPGGAAIEDGVLRGEVREGAYSQFLAWRDAGFPEIGLCNLFGSALVLSADGALIYGVMGEHTANAGRIYPPGGTLEPGDVRPDGLVDVIGSINRELGEETGLSHEDAQIGGMLAVFEGPLICVARIYRFADTAEQLLARIRANLDLQEERELADVVAVRSGAEAKAAGPCPGFAIQLADRIATPLS
jgi:8-oxo-dGTP pyrophosphatase MutT (NUDIX family)